MLLGKSVASIRQNQGLHLIWFSSSSKSKLQFYRTKKQKQTNNSTGESFGEKLYIQLAIL